MKKLITKLVTALFLVLPLLSFSQEQKKPNIIVILADDLGALKGDWKLIKDLGIKKKKMDGDVLFHLPPDSSEQNNLKDSNDKIYNALKQAVASYDAIKAPKELLSKGPKNGFVAPKKWKITKEK